QGRVRVTQGDAWLKLSSSETQPASSPGLSWLPNAPAANAGDDNALPVRAKRDKELQLRVDARKMTGGQTYSGRLTAITNGGVLEVPVRLDLTATPFSEAPFQGATTPRELAQRMLTNPKKAVPLLESGVVARWFTAN